MRRNENEDETKRTDSSVQHSSSYSRPYYSQNIQNGHPSRRVLIRRKRPQKNWFQRFFGLKRKRRDVSEAEETLIKLLNGQKTSKRQKRGLFDAFLDGWTGTRLMGCVFHLFF